MARLRGLLVDARVTTISQLQLDRTNTDMTYLPALPIPPSSNDFDTHYVKAASYTTNQPQGEFDERHRTSVQALFATDPADDMHMIANKKDKLLDTTE